jgi:hypothetical protein
MRDLLNPLNTVTDEEWRLSAIAAKANVAARQKRGSLDGLIPCWLAFLREVADMLALDASHDNYMYGSGVGDDDTTQYRLDQLAATMADDGICVELCWRPFDLLRLITGGQEWFVDWSTTPWPTAVSFEAGLLAHGYRQYVRALAA